MTRNVISKKQSTRGRGILEGGGRIQLVPLKKLTLNQQSTSLQVA